MEVWFGRTDRNPLPELEDLFLPLLSISETTRYHRFVQEQTRHEYLLAHGMLRLLLRRCVDGWVEGCEFQHGPFGKPTLPGGAGPEFSLSHTSGLVVCSASFDGPLGVDAEAAERSGQIDAVAATCFTEEERRLIEGCGRAERLVWLWTAKESVLKARGTGLSDPLESAPILWSVEGPRTPDWILTRLRIDRSWMVTFATAGPMEVTGICEVQRGQALSANGDSAAAAGFTDLYSRRVV